MKKEEEVKKEVKEVKKDALLDIVFSSLDAGKTTKQIIKELDISKQKLQYYLDKLKTQGKIRKISYGVWQTSKNTVANSCRGHGFMWHIKLPSKINVWDKILVNKKIPFTQINNNHTYQFYFKDRKVWASKKSIIIYEIKSFFGYNAVDSKKYAFFELRELLNDLQAKLGISLQKNNQYIVKTARQHYALIKNCLAIQCNKEHKKINVYNENGLWFVIDNSFNFEEAETISPKTALTDNLGIQKYFNEHKETNFEVTPKFILNSFNLLIQDRAYWAEHQKSHVEAIQTLSSEVKRMSGEITRLNEIISSLKKD